MAYSAFNFQVDDGIATICLNDPERLNALTFETYAELERVFAAIATTELEAARLLVYQAAWAHDVGAADAKLKSSMAKLHATEAAQKIVDQALQINGGNGLVAGSSMERLYRDVRALRIYEGTSEIQKIVIARELLKQA